MNRRLFSLLCVAPICFSCGLNGQSGDASDPRSLSSRSAEETTLFDLLEWTKEIKAEDVASITHTHGSNTVYFGLIHTDYSTDAADIASFFSFLQTPAVAVSKEEALVEGGTTDYYVVKAKDSTLEYPLSLQQGYISVINDSHVKSYYKIKGEAVRLNHATSTFHFINTGIHSLVRTYDDDKDFGLFYHLEELTFAEAPSGTEWAEPFYYLESPFGPIEVLSKNACLMNVDGAKKTYFVTGKRDFSPIFDMEKGLFAFDVLHDASPEFITEHYDTEFMVFSEKAQLPSFFQSETTNEQFRKRFDDAFFEDHALILWNVITNYYYQRVYPRKYEVTEEGIALYADTTEMRGGWAMCGEYFLFYAIPKTLLPLEASNINGTLSIISD